MENKRHKVLLIEDDKIDQMAFERLLTDENLSYDCTIAESIRDAKEILREQKFNFNIVIMDYILGDGTAFDIIGLIKDTPIIITTGVGDEEIAVKAMKAGVYDYLIKDSEQKYLKFMPVIIGNAIKHKDMDDNLRMLSTAVEQSPSMIIITDTKGNIEYVNQKFTQLTGYALEEVAGKTPRILKSGENPPEMYKRLWKTITSGGEWHGEFRNKKKNSELYWISGFISPIKNSDGVITRFIEVCEDITKQKEAENKIKEATEAKTNFTSMVSHELRTPLTTIEESIAVILDGLTGVINDEQKEYLTIAKRNVDRLARLINNVLDFEKLGSGRIEFNMLENDINEVVKEAQETMSHLISEKGLNLIVKADEKLPRLRFDRDSIIQVLENIINNAIKVTYKGSITIITDKVEDTIHVSVEDTGIGIRKEDMSKLFHEFEQLARGKDRKTGGTGLGLAISKKIIEKHNGKIWAESEPGKGSTFHFTLPVK